jgi:hypothetical protein
MIKQRSDIILIGPTRAGKTTIAGLLAEQLKLPHIKLDDLRWQYYQEAGYDPDFAKQIRQTGGFVSLVFYWKLFDTHAVERVLADYTQCIHDFVAGHTVNENRDFFKRVETALKPYPNIILILPSPNPDESIRILNERTQDLVGSFGQGFNWNEYFVKSECNSQLAKFVVYTEGKTPQESCEEILVLLKRKGSHFGV